MLPIEYYNNDNTQPTHHDFQNVVEFEVTYLHFTEYYKLSQKTKSIYFRRSKYFITSIDIRHIYLS